MRFNFYAETEGIIHPQLHIERFYHHEVTATSDNTKTKLFFEFIYSTSQHVCLNYGLNSQKVRLTLLTNLWLKDCYKDLLDTIFNLDKAFLDPNARWIDKCTDSIDTDITLIEYIPVTATKDYYWFGDGLVTNCWPGDLSATIPWAWNILAFVI